MSKIKLGTPPKNFKASVSIPMIDGTTDDIEVNFKYRTKSEYGALVDEIMKDADKPKKASAKTVEETIKNATQANVDFILKIADGWSLEEEFNAKNIALLDDEYQGAIAAISEAYRIALIEGRTKN